MYFGYTCPSFGGGRIGMHSNRCRLGVIANATARFVIFASLFKNENHNEIYKKISRISYEIFKKAPVGERK